MPALRRFGSGGFTLIEILTAMAVLAILFTLSISMLRGSKQRAAIARGRGELAALAQALEAYKNHYGDYPETGNLAQATPIVTADVAANSAQAALFNALIGVYAATDFSTPRNGPALIEISKFRLEETRDYTNQTRSNSYTLGVATGNPPMKQRVGTCFLDPWGNRYLYYYKPARTSGSSAAATWRLPNYVLYSAGPDGQQTPPDIRTGLFTGTTQTSGTNADNIYATP